MLSSGLCSWRLPALHSDWMNFLCNSSGTGLSGLKDVSLFVLKCFNTDCARLTYGPYAPPIDVTLLAPTIGFLSWNCFLHGIFMVSSSAHC